MNGGLYHGHHSRLLWIASIIMSISISLAQAQAGDLFDPGQRVAIEFTCRLKDGSLVITTDKGLTEDESVKKATIFAPRKSDLPLIVNAGDHHERKIKNELRGFEQKIIDRLALALPGMASGEKRLLTITAEKDTVSRKSVVEMARIRKRPKIIRMSIDAYANETGHSPQVGDRYIIDPLVPGMVTTVSGEEVVIGFEAKNGQKVLTPIGPGVIRETESNFEIHIQVRVGELVRTAGMIGRVVAIDEQLITINYGHPFGGEAIECEMVGHAVAAKENG